MSFQFLQRCAPRGPGWVIAISLCCHGCFIFGSSEGGPPTGSGTPPDNGGIISIPDLDAGYPVGNTSGVRVAVSPGQVVVGPAGTVQFTAEVTFPVGSTLADRSVVWSVEGESSKVGAISQSGLYVASLISGTYTVHATSVSAPDAEGHAPVTVNANAFALNPPRAVVHPGMTQQFSATLANGSPANVAWRVVEGVATAGTISTTGLYRAPVSAGTFHVEAVSVADPSLARSVAVEVRANDLVAVSACPSFAALIPGESFTAMATLNDPEDPFDTALEWSILDSAGSAARGSTVADGVVTAGAEATSFVVRAASRVDPSKYADVMVNVLSDNSRTLSGTVSYDGAYAGAVHVTAFQLGGGSVVLPPEQVRAGGFFRIRGINPERGEASFASARIIAWLDANDDGAYQAGEPLGVTVVQAPLMAPQFVRIVVEDPPLATDPPPAPNDFPRGLPILSSDGETASDTDRFVMFSRVNDDVTGMELAAAYKLYYAQAGILGIAFDDNHAPAVTGLSSGTGHVSASFGGQTADLTMTVDPRPPSSAQVEMRILSGPTPSDDEYYSGHAISVGQHAYVKVSGKYPWEPLHTPPRPLNQVFDFTSPVGGEPHCVCASGGQCLARVIAPSERNSVTTIEAMAAGVCVLSPPRYSNGSSNTTYTATAALTIHGTVTVSPVPRDLLPGMNVPLSAFCQESLGSAPEPIPPDEVGYDEPDSAISIDDGVLTPLAVATSTVVSFGAGTGPTTSGHCAYQSSAPIELRVYPASALTSATIKCPNGAAVGLAAAVSLAGSLGSLPIDLTPFTTRTVSPPDQGTLEDCTSGCHLTQTANVTLGMTFGSVSRSCLIPFWGTPAMGTQLTINVTLEGIRQNHPRTQVFLPMPSHPPIDVTDVAQCAVRRQIGTGMPNPMMDPVVAPAAPCNTLATSLTLAPGPGYYVVANIASPTAQGVGAPLSVAQVNLAPVSVSIWSSVPMPPGVTVHRTADVLYPDSVWVHGAQVTWSTSDSSIASVDSEGRVQAHRPGTVTLRASAGSVVDTDSVTVLDAHLTSVQIYNQLTGTEGPFLPLGFTSYLGLSATYEGPTCPEYGCYWTLTTLARWSQFSSTLPSVTVPAGLQPVAFAELPGLSPGVDYTVWQTAVNAAGESAPSPDPEGPNLSGSVPSDPDGGEIHGHVAVSAGIPAGADAYLLALPVWGDGGFFIERVVANHGAGPATYPFAIHGFPSGLYELMLIGDLDADGTLGARDVVVRSAITVVDAPNSTTLEIALEPPPNVTATTLNGVDGVSGAVLNLVLQAGIPLRVSLDSIDGIASAAAGLPVDLLDFMGSGEQPVQYAYSTAPQPGGFTNPGSFRLGFGGARDAAGVPLTAAACSGTYPLPAVLPVPTGLSLVSTTPPSMSSPSTATVAWTTPRGAIATTVRLEDRHGRYSAGPFPPGVSSATVSVPTGVFDLVVTAIDGQGNLSEASLSGVRVQ